MLRLHPGDDVGVGDDKLHRVWMLCGCEDVITYFALLSATLMGAPEGGQVVCIVVLLELLLLFVDKRTYFLFPCGVINIQIPGNDDIVWGIVASGVDGVDDFLYSVVVVVFTRTVCCFVIVVVITRIGVGIKVDDLEVTARCCYRCCNVIICYYCVLWVENFFCYC